MLLFHFDSSRKQYLNFKKFPVLWLNEAEARLSPQTQMFYGFYMPSLWLQQTLAKWKTMAEPEARPAVIDTPTQSNLHTGHILEIDTDSKKKKRDTGHSMERTIKVFGNKS